jgi:sugar O-acyltransferase (sialic acid O-acetyltransferase NeuD family)
MSRPERRAYLVYGAGGHGKVVADLVLDSGETLLGFIDDDPRRAEEAMFGLPVRSLSEWLKSGNPRVALGIGDNAVRRSVFQKVREAGLPLATLVHRSASVARSAELGDATVAMAGCVVNADARIGLGAILNSGCVVEHEVILGDFVHVSPSAALGGGARVGPGTHIGMGAMVLPGIRIGANVRVGAGAVVTRAVDDGVTLVGVPARPR